MSERLNTYMWAVICIFLIVMVSPAFAGKIIYVDDDAEGANDGSSWTDAYKYLQDALADANSADKPVEIRVARGIYRPDRNTAEPNGTGDRTATFQLINGVTLKGGYAGLGKADPNVRNIELYETILSGDLNGDDINVNDSCNLVNEPTRLENSFHVITGSSTDETASLDGFTITAGNASGPWTQTQVSNVQMFNGQGGSAIAPPLFNVDGGGMLNESGSPTLANCIFSENSAFEDGGGMCNKSGSNPTVNNCTFSQNSAHSGGGIHSASNSSLLLRNCILSRNSASFGGGILSWNNDLTLINCTFSGNLAGSGGGLYNGGGKSILTNCIFSCNWANGTQGCGGGLYYSHGDLTLANCMFMGNLSNWRGGALCNHNSSGNGSVVELTNCTFAANSAVNGNAVTCDSYLHQNPTKMSVTNCILWDSGNEIENVDGSIIRITYSNVHGGWPGQGNIDVDPYFANAGYWGDAKDPNIHIEQNDPNAVWINGDYHLKSQAGRWTSASSVEPDADEGRWTKDDVTSPCIDAGDPSSPIGFEPFPNGGIINMGAYGGTAEASKSYFGSPVCETIIAGDINGDCKVDFRDFVLMVYHWHEDKSP